MKRMILRTLSLPALALVAHAILVATSPMAFAQDPFADDPEPVPAVIDGDAAIEAIPELFPGAVEGAVPYGYGVREPDLFYNYYAPSTAGGAPAQLYLAPRPVPERVGHTYYTYQPLYPHEYMYPHYREYYTYKGNYHHYGCANSYDSLNRTTVRYQRGNLSSLYFYPLFRYVPSVPKCLGGRSGGGRCLGGLGRCRGEVATGAPNEVVEK